MKWICLAAIFLVPLGSYLLWHYANARKPDSKVLTGLRPLIGVSCWLLALFFMFTSQGFHERDWWATHDHSAGLTEDDLLELGDYPNVFAGWVIAGWVPVLVMSLVARFIYRKRSNPGGSNR